MIRLHSRQAFLIINKVGGKTNKQIDMEAKQINYGDILYHHSSCVSFKYLGEIKPQFSSEIFVELLNLKSGSVERFSKRTYLSYFKIVKK